jgi:ATP-binding cassette subfamily C (CFTR/MRP) protein 1
VVKLTACSVDSETEAIMQEIIDSKFKKCTVLAAMHRPKHIARYDIVTFLDDWALLEYGEPATLMVENMWVVEL